MPSTGSVSMTVVGSGLGHLDYTGASRVGLTACEASGWESDSSVRCLGSGGVFGTLRVAMTAGIRAGSVTEGLSYDVPMLAGGLNLTFNEHTNATFVRSNSPSTGSASVTIVGSGMGLTDFSGASRLGASACEATSWDSDSSLRCRSPSGVLATLRVAITAGVRAGSVTEGLSYDLRNLVAVSCTGNVTDCSAASGNVPAVGLVVIRVEASGFGLREWSAGSRLGHTACEASEWESDSSLRCMTAGGVGGSMRVAVTAGARVGSLTDVVSYDTPSLAYIIDEQGNAFNATANLPSGGSVVTVLGAGLGVMSYTDSARTGQSRCEATEWQSDSSLTCKTARGTGGTKRVAITAGVRVGTVTEAVSYDAPTLDRFTNNLYELEGELLNATGRANVVAVGGVEIVLSGAGLGLDSYTGASRVGQTGCEASKWASDTSLVCKTAGGVFGTLRVAVTAGARVGSVTEAVSYDVPMLAGGLDLSFDEDVTATFGRTNSPSTGSVSMTVVGSMFGESDYTGASRVGSTACEASGWESDSSVRCLSSGGVVGTQRFAVTAGIRAGSVTEGLSFDLATLSGTVRANAPSTGNVSVTVLGANLAHSAYTAAARFAATACEHSAWESDSSLRCLAPGGVLGTLRVAVTAGARVGSLTDSVSYDTPSLAYVVDEQGNAFNATANLPSGGSVVTVLGAGLGVMSYTDSARTGQSRCEATEWQSDSSLTCKTARGTGGTEPVAITAGVRVGTVTEAVSYDAPTLDSITNNLDGEPQDVTGHANVAAVGGVEIVLYGESMALDSYTARSRVGQTGCEASEWASDSSLVCKTAGGVFGTLRVAMTAGARVGSVTEAVSYDVPMLGGGLNLTSDDMDADENATNATTFGRTNSPSTGSVSMTVVGSMFGESDYTAAARLGASACEASEWESDSSVRCLTSTGIRATLRVAVTAVIRAGSVTEGLSFDLPMLDEVIRANAPSTGAVRVTVLGANLAHSAYTAAARFAATACEHSTWESDSALRCLTAGGVSATLRVAVTAGARAGSMTEAGSYDSPNLLTVVTDTATAALPGTNSTANVPCA
ncbi:hypothetical protein T484DRAFT_1849086 [Baffinella frigidus]|nr:hypothetical protein T484DRAFT_1849086 [Cryptophyta sp. CCMP2293]